MVLDPRPLREQPDNMLEDDRLELAEEHGVLERLAGDVEGEVLRVDDDLDPGGPFGEGVLAEVGGDEGALDEELGVLAAGFEGLLPEFFGAGGASVRRLR